MSELIKKREIPAIKNKYTVPMTDEMKTKLDELRDEKEYDVNEMLRKAAAKIISQAEKESA